MDRNWFPAILLGLTILLALIFAAALSPRGRDLLRADRDVHEATAPAVRVTEEGYQAAANAILDTYATTHDAQAAYDALILLRVPASMMNAHYELVIALQKQVAGDTADAAARFAALKAQYPWLNLTVGL